MSSADDLLYEPIGDRGDSPIASASLTGVDILYHRGPNSTRYFFNAVSDRAKDFFCNSYGWNVLSQVNGYLPPVGWNPHLPPSDFRFVEWTPGMPFPDDAWGSRPDALP